MSVILQYCHKDQNKLDISEFFKTKRNSKGNIEQFKAQLIAKGFAQKDDINYKEIFSSVSIKKSFRIIMALVAHFYLQLHQMDVKIVFLNGDFEEEIYMTLPEGLQAKSEKNLLYKLKRSIYGLKQVFRQQYLKFNVIITFVRFKKSIID